MSGSLPATPGQTVGPFFGFALPYRGDSELVASGAVGAIRLHGTITDGSGAPVPDALVEISQPGAQGALPDTAGSLRRDGWTFTGWGRASTDDAGCYSFTTLEPEPCDACPAPFFAVTVFARGLLDRLFTRAYVPVEGLDSVALLAALPPARRRTLIAVRDRHGLRFDIRLQEGSEGSAETVFLQYPQSSS